MLDKPFVRSAYNYDRDVSSKTSGAEQGDESQTQQHFAEEVDINTLVRRFHLSGEMPADVRPVTYGDFSDVHDFHSAANAIAAARESFEAMPAEMRRKFENDPARFVDFCSKSENLDEMRKMGLAVPAPVEPPAAPAAIAPTVMPAAPAASPEAAKPVPT